MNDDESSANKKKADNAHVGEILFREAMHDVRPLKPTEKVDQATSPRHCQAIHKRRNRAIGAAAIPDTLSDHLTTEMAENGNWSFIRPGLQRQTLRKLRRGDWPAQAQLDLHGLTREMARCAMTAFLADSIQQGFRCVRVIHGKGLSSNDKAPVLKKLTGNWLVQHESVLAFCQAKPENGGSGALEVLLKKHRPNEKISAS